MSSIRIKILDSVFKLFLILFKRKNNSSKIFASEPLNILLINLGNIQQALSITPLISVLSNNLNCNITTLINQTNYPVFSNNKNIRSSIIYKKESFRILKTLKLLIQRNYDIVIDTHEQINRDVSIIVGILRTKYKIGFKKADENLLTHSLQIKDHNKVHVVDRILDITDAFEIYFSKTDLNIYYSPSGNAKKVIEDFTIKHDLKHKMTVMLNLTGNDGIGFWGIDNYKRLLKFLKNYNINVIISASIDDIESAEILGTNNNIIFYDSEFDIFSELVRNVNFIFSPDSYLIQLAAAFKIPIFCLFVQHKNNEMINVPYNSDFDFAITEKNALSDISYGKVLNSFVSYFDFIYEKYNSH